MSHAAPYDPIETASSDALRAVQLDRLRWTVSQAASSEHYAKLFASIGLGPDSVPVRSLDDLRIRGVNIFPMQIERVLMAMPEVGRNYLIVLDRDGYADRLTVKIEVAPDFFRDEVHELLRLQDRISHALREEILVRPRVELVEPGSIPRREGKAVRVVDERG